MSAPNIKPKDLARELDVSLMTLSRWRSKDRGPKWIGVGRGIRYRRSDVDAWITQREGRHLK